MANNIRKIASDSMPGLVTGTIMISSYDGPATVPQLKNKNNYIFLLTIPNHYPGANNDSLSGISACCLINNISVVTIADKGANDSDRIVTFDKFTGTLTPSGTYYGHWCCYNNTYRSTWRYFGWE